MEYACLYNYKRGAICRIYYYSAKQKSPSNFPTMYFHVWENENAEEIHLEITDRDEHGGGILRILTTSELAEIIKAHGK